MGKGLGGRKEMGEGWGELGGKGREREGEKRVEVRFDGWG